MAIKQKPLAQIAFTVNHAGDDDLFFLNFVNDAIAVGE
jgi:hypothetical protein